jgi:hypothetical protein
VLDLLVSINATGLANLIDSYLYQEIRMVVFQSGNEGLSGTNKFLDFLASAASVTLLII